MSAANDVTAPAARMWPGRSRRPFSIRPASTMCTQTTPASSATHRASLLTNPIDGKYYDWPVGFNAGQEPRRILEARRAQARRNHLHPLCGWHRAQEPHAGQRFRQQPDVCTRRHLLQLPRSPWQRQCREWCGRPANALCLDLPRPEHAGRPHARQRSSSTRTMQPAAPDRLHRLPYAEIAQTGRGRECPQPHLPLRHASAKPRRLKIPNACNVCHTDKTTGVGGSGADHMEGSFTLANGPVTHNAGRRSLT